jgi:putative hydrolase of the HAD superfamily
VKKFRSSFTPMQKQDTKIDPVLFDFGGVIAEEGFRQGLEVIAQANGLDAESFLKTAHNIIYSTGYILGKAPESEFWSVLRQATGILGDDQQFRNEILSRFILRDWMIDLIIKLKTAHIKVGILSDQTDMLDRLDEKYHLFRLFDYVFNSYHMGKGKRDPSQFDDVARVIGIPAERILFIDDDPGNCERARQRGFNVIHFTDRDGFLKEFQNILPLN